MKQNRLSQVLLGATLLQLPATTQASILTTLLWGKDTLEPIRQAIASTQQLRSEVYGWYNHNLTQQSNFTVTPDPVDLYTILPSTYSGRSLVDPDGSYYSDVEGYYKGQWSGWDFSTKPNRSVAVDSRLNHTAAQRLASGTKPGPVQYVDGVNGTQLKHDRGEFDWLTVEPGHMDLHLVEEHLLPSNISLVTGSLTFNSRKNSHNTIDSVDFSLEGLHFIPTGTLFLHAVSDESLSGTDVRTSLSLIPTGNNETVNATIAAIDKAFQLRIDMLNRIVKSGSWDAPESSDGGGELPKVKHNCSLHVYGQFSSAGPYTSIQPQISALESERKHRTGISTITLAPPLLLSLTAYSPECQFLLTTQAAQLSGLLQTQLWKKAVHYGVIYFIVLFIQTYLLVQQMEVSTTPSGLAKLADKTWLAQSVLDAYGCLVHLSVGVAVENEVTKVMVGCSFLAGVCFLAFGYRFTIVIYRSQVDGSSTAPATAVPALRGIEAQNASGQTGEAEGVSSNTTNTTTTTTTDSSATTAPQNLITRTLNNFTTDTTNVTPEEIAARKRGIIILLTFLFLLLVALYPIFTVTLMHPFLYSFWIPQIYRNVIKGTRKALLKRVIIGTTLTRLYVPMYVLVCPDNVLFSGEGKMVSWGWALGGYVVAQAVVLLGQDVIGPHWFLPVRYRPSNVGVGWEYHPISKYKVGDGDEEEEEGGVWGDCAICLTPIGNSGDGGGGKRRKKGNGGVVSILKRESKRWFGLGSSSSSSYGYDRIANTDEEQHYDLDPSSPSEPPRQVHPPEKPSNPQTSQSLRSHNDDDRNIINRRTILARIITQNLSWRTNNNRERGGKGGRRRTDIMQAPCHHVFHTSCLERWLEIKGECPTCRAVLPPPTSV